MRPTVPGVYPWPYDGDWHAGNTALVVIDMQRDFCAPGGWVDQLGEGVDNTRRPIPTIARVLAAMRRHRFTVIHTREGHRPDLSDLNPNKQWRTRRHGLGIGDQGREGRILVRGEPGWRIVDDVAPLPGEVIVDKPGKGAFWATDLDQILRRQGVHNLVITGITTDCCVQSTMREADDRGYDCLLLEDGCAAVEQRNHDATIAILKAQGGRFGSVARADDLLHALEGHA